MDEAVEPRVADHEGFALQRLSAAETPQRVSEAENGVPLEPAVNVQQDDRDKSTPKSQVTCTLRVTLIRNDRPICCTIKCCMQMLLLVIFAFPVV